MAQYIQTVSGSASTAANNRRITSVATAHATNTTSDFVSSSVNTDTFTAPSTSDQAYGVGVYLTSNNLSTGAVVRATLQEDAGAGFVDTACYGDYTVATAFSDYIYFDASALAYTFTTTTANKYRWKIVKQSGTGTLLRARSSTTGSSTPWAFFVDSRTGTPGTSDDFLVANGVTSTLTNGMSFGTGTSTSQSNAPTVFHQIAHHVLPDAISEFDTTASTTVTIKGMIIPSVYGTWRIGSEGTPYPSSYVAKLIMDMNSVAGNYGLWSSSGNIVLNGGYQPTNYAVNYVSGLGTAASPMITDGDIGAVGDEVCIAGTGNYNQTEYRFIKTKNSATSYVLSSTSGGAESALVNTHSTRAKVLNMQRNIIVEPANTSFPNYILHTGTSWFTTGKFYGKNFRTNYIGNSGVGKFGVTLGYSSGQSTMVIQEFSGYVSNRASYSGLYLQSNRTDYTTYSDNIFVRSASVQPAFTTVASNKVLNRFYVVDNTASAWGFSTTNNVTANDSYFYCNNTGNGTNGGHLFVTVSSTSVTLNNCDFQWARQGAIRNLAVAMTSWKFTDCKFGDVGTNVIDINLGSSSLMDVDFANCIFSSPTLISGYLTMIEGSEVRFQRYQQSATSHRWYTNRGKARAESTTKRTGSLSLAIEPEDATNGFVWEFHVPANANQQIFLPGYFYRSSITGDVTVDIFLPYSTTSDETLTLPTTSGSWQPFLISQDYSQSENELATIRFTVKSAAGTLYLDDFLNSGNTVDVNNNIASFETWFNGKPVDLFSLLDVSAIPAQTRQEVWADENIYGAGTKGKTLKDASDSAELASIT